MTADPGNDVLDIRVEPYDGPVAQQFTAAVQAEYVQRYGGPDDAPIDAAEFQLPAGAFVVGYFGETPVAMGGFRRLPDNTVEIKRMYVAVEFRGRGLSRILLRALEDMARRQGANRVVLETGQAQPEAISLYESSGYERIPGFGHYACQPLSVSYGKSL